ncbi:MAG: cysteine--tRNA ligase [Candidatus Levybacteria bacterium]|nr:cysteine--tRNA ligase [Candidatus Levybacteria bacterium]
MKLYNTLTQTIEPFKPQNPPNVTMYVCGITPYDTAHLGHAFTYVHFDVLYRFLQYKKYKVIYTQNVTDINDRDKDILARAKEQNVPWNKLANYWTKRFLDNMKALNWQMPTQYLKASEQIASMIAIIEALLKNGYAYQNEGNVFLDVTKVSDFGKLSRLTQVQMVEKAKEFEEDLDNPLKRHKLDITLWRSALQNQPAHIPSFDSTLGKGRPGWHIECSAMAISSLGEQIDIHGGGQDLIYPHHESEIAQSEAATGKIPFVKYWLHTGTVMYKGKKMSKSLGNLVLVADLLKKYSPNVIRFVLLLHHYRSAWEFNQQEFDKAQESIDKLSKSNKIEGTSFTKYLDDDMNTPLLISEIIKINDEKGVVEKDAVYVLGLNV